MSKKDLIRLTAGSVMLTGFLLTGCSSSGYYYDRKTDYVDAKEYPAITLPATANASQFRQAMPLPDISGQEKLDDDFVVPRPDALPVVNEDLPPSALKEYAGAGNIEPRLWLSIANAPAVAWPLLQQQFERLNWTVKTADPSTGRLSFVPNTQLSAQPVYAKLRQGLRSGSSDFELLNRDETIRIDSTAKALLSQINTGLSDLDPSSQSVSLLAQNISREKTVVLQASSGQDPVLKISTDIARTWIGLELLLTEQFKGSEQKLVSADIVKREFTIIWLPEEDRSNFFTRWAVSPGPEHSYQLVLTGSSPVNIRVQQNGQVVNPKSARQVLGSIRKLLN